MKSHVDHDVLNHALRRCGASWPAAQVHGLLSGRLAIAGERGVAESLGQVLDGGSASDVLKKECEDMQATLWQSTHMVFSERPSAFEPLLPDESDNPGTRTEALAHWCEGYLQGLVSGEHDAAQMIYQELAELRPGQLQ